ncbi:MAG: hypothetical protein JW729_02230, partial [Bacteroidales bacterium]|nr:hypothetical protein [Bacteroidales bacterium]
MKLPEQNQRFYAIAIAILLLVAALIRFDRFWEIPLTYDELSALSRLRFNSFAELIQFGIKPDGHPAGVQLFLFYWTHLVG